MVFPTFSLAKQIVPEDLCVPDNELVGRTKISLRFEATAYLSCLTELCKLLRIDTYLQDVDFWLDNVLSIHLPSKTDLFFLYPKTWWPDAKASSGVDERAFRQANQRFSLMLARIRTLQTDLCRVLQEQHILIPYLEGVVDRCKDYRKSVHPKGLPDFISVSSIFFVALSLFQDHISTAIKNPDSIKPCYSQILNVCF